MLLQVCCLPGFRQFAHYCPLCNALLGIGKPSHTGNIALIVILSLITMAVVGFLIYVKLIM